MEKPKVVDGKVTLTELQFGSLRVAAGQYDFACFHGDVAGMEAAWHYAKAALASIGALTAEEEHAAEEEEDD